MKKVTIILSFIFVLVAFAMWANNAEARSGFWAGQGGCVACHAGEDNSCAGCHAHGTPSDSGKDDINVVASTDKTTYAPGEDVTVSITGGYRSGWVRAILYNENGVEVARSSGSGGTGGGLEFPGPIVLTAPAPADPGLYTWEASWYGNEYDLGNIGGSTFFGPGWIPDPNNANHGEEVVFVNPFDVVAAAECGDRNTDPGEECDDGNNTNGDGCENDCTITPATTTTTTVPATTTTTTVPSDPVCGDYPDKGSCNADPNCQYFGKGKNGYCDDAPPPGDCSSLGRRKDCKADSNCSWVDNQCVDFVLLNCGDFTKKNTCTANGCSWDRVSGCSD